MIARSMVKPKVFWLRKKEIIDDRLIIWLRIRWDIKVIEVKNIAGELHREYEFNEEELRLNFNADLFDETGNLNAQIKDYLKAHKTTLRKRIKKIIFLHKHIESIEGETD